MKTLYSYYKGIGVFFLLSLFGFQMNAQDIHFSQFGNSPVNINPALSGMFAGDFRFTGNYRSQWNSVPVSYLTFSGAIDTKIDKYCSNHDQWGIGLIFNYDRAGDSRLYKGQLGLTGSYTHRVNTNNFISAGLMLSGYQRGFDMEDLQWDRQFEGRWFDPNRWHGENIPSTSVTYGDFSIGFNWHYQKPTRYVNWNPNNRTKLDVGGALFHINRPNKSFWEDDDVIVELGRRLALYGIGIFRLTDALDLKVQAMHQRQESDTEVSRGFLSPHQETVVGIGGKLHLDQGRARQLSILLGLNFRLPDSETSFDALIPTVEIQYNAWRVGLSYDINMSMFDIATDRFGGPELALQYIFVKPRLDNFINCNPIY